MKKLSKLFIVLILIVFVWLVLQKSPGLLAPKQEIKKISINQQIDEPNSGLITNTYQAENNETALDLLKRTADIETKGEGVDAYVTKINKTEADTTKNEFWAFYVNGKMAEVGVGSYKLMDGDKIEWKIEKY